MFQIVLPLLCSGSFFLSGQTNYDWTFYDASNSPLPENTVRCITIDSNGDYWFGTDLGLAFFDGLNWIVYNDQNSPLTDNYIRALEFDANGDLWIGTTQSGIFTFDMTNWTVIDPGNSDLPSYFIRSIKKDQDGAMWVGTVEGLARYASGTWTVWTVAGNGLNSNNISCFGVDENNRKYIGTINGGLMVFENETITEYTILEGGIPDNSSIGMVFDSNNNPWIASPSGGLFTTDASQLIVEPIPNWTSYNMLNSPIPTNSLTSILIDQQSNFFMGSTEHGLITFSPPSGWEVIDTSNSALPDNHILCLLQDPEGYIWMGTSTAGIVRIKKNVQSIEETTKKPLLLYPNPVIGNLYIEGFDPYTPVTISLETMDGRLVKEYNPDNYTASYIELDMSTFTPGQYLLRLNSGHDQFIKQIVKL
jgi:ligand-binding sensor domain-containing protein